MIQWKTMKNNEKTEDSKMIIGNTPLYQMTDCVSRAVTAENFTGEKGKGGMATEGTGASCARDIGQGWKGSPSFVVKAV